MSDWLPKLDKIDDPIADDVWSYTLSDGKRRFTRLTIGKPCPIPGDPNGDWYCPFLIDRPLSKVELAIGVGPVDALLNAMRVIRDFYEDAREVRPRARLEP